MPKFRYRFNHEISAGTELVFDSFTKSLTVGEETCTPIGARNQPTSKELVEAFELGPAQVAWAALHCPSVAIITETADWRERCRDQGYHTVQGRAIRNAELSWKTAMRNAEKWGGRGRLDRRGITAKTETPSATSGQPEWEPSEFDRPGATVLRWAAPPAGNVRLRKHATPDQSVADMDTCDLRDLP